MVRASLASLLALCILLALLPCVFLLHRASPRVDPIVCRRARGVQQLHVVTVVTDRDKAEFKTLVRIAGKYGTRVNAAHPLGEFGHQSGGWGQRLRTMRLYLSTLPPEDIVMFVDGYDLLIGASPECILGEFDDMIGDREVVLFSAESNCYPIPEVESEYPEPDPPSPYKYLNAGACIGRVDIFARLLDTHMHFEDPDFNGVHDQGEFTKIFLATDDIELDTSNRIFNSMFDREHDLEHHVGRGWFNKATHTYPMVFHANGQTPQRMLFDTIAPTLE